MIAFIGDCRAASRRRQGYRDYTVGGLLALANNTGLTNADLWGGKSCWNLYFWFAFLITMLAVPPVSSIIFLASFVPCLMAAGVPVKFSRLLVVWLERMILSILFTGLFAVLLFPAAAVA